MSATASPFTVVETGFAGLHVLQPRVWADPRGVFVKTFQADVFRDLGIRFEPCEEFYSVSAKNVVRGLHFQLPPAAHAKLVYCLAGAVLDVVVDLRRHSPTFRRVFSRELSGRNRELLFIPVGFAHGFVALEDESSMVYKTDTVHTPACDAGIAWDSISFPWPAQKPVLSERDRGFPALRDFQSPF